MQEKKTQKEMVLSYIREHGSISSMEGYEHLNITDTRTIISRIRKDLEGTSQAVIKKKIYPKSGKGYARWYISTGKALHCPLCNSTLDSGLVDWYRRYTIWTCPSCSRLVREGVVNYPEFYPDPPEELRGDNSWVMY